MEHDPKDGFHPKDYRNPREHRVIDFLFPILYPEKPKRLSITMANTIFGALSGKSASQMGATHPGIGGEINPPHWQETLSSLPLPSSPLLAEWLPQQGRGGRHHDCGG